MATEEVTTEASLPEQRVTTMEEHLNNINNVDAPSHNDSTSDTCNLNNDNSDTRYHARGEERLFDSLLEELFFLDDATPQLERQLASRYISAMGGPAGWLDRPAGSIVAIIIRVYLVATNERYKAAEAEWDRLEKTMKEIKRKTMAMLFRKWHSVVSDKLDAVGRTDEVEIKGSKKLASLTRKAERAEKRLARQQVRLAVLLAERGIKERDLEDAQRRWKASKKKLEGSFGRSGK